MDAPIYTCAHAGCTYSTPFQSNFKRHGKKHEPRCLTCARCGYEASCALALNGHIRKHYAEQAAASGVVRPVAARAAQAAAEAPIVGYSRAAKAARREARLARAAERAQRSGAQPLDPSALQCEHCPFVGKNKCAMAGHSKRHKAAREGGGGGAADADEDLLGAALVGLGAGPGV